MISGTTYKRGALIASVMLGALAFAAAAFAVAPESSPMLGVDENTAVALGPEVPAEAKFLTTADSGVSENSKLLAPAAKKVSKAAAAPARTQATPKAEKKSGKTAKPAKRVKTAKTSKRTDAQKKDATSGSWKKARVSWYGPGFYGNGMAGGGKLTKTSMVCAHRSLPFGTKIQFSYKGRKVNAVVKDRGPFIAGRVFDLGPGTAKALKFGGVGTVKYRIIK